MPPPVLTEEEQRKRQERIDQISVETSWTVQQEQMESYLHMVESSTLVEDVEAAAGAMVDLYKELKLTWQKKVATVKSEDYVRELSWMNKVKIRMNFGERRFKAMDTQRRDAHALSFATSSSTLPLSSTSQSGSTGQMHAKLPKLEMPKFSGLTIDWPNFEDRFESAVGRNLQLAAVDKFQYLLAACQGDAKKLIESYPMEDASFQAALDLLKSTYKSDLMQKSALLAAIKSLPLISSSRPIALVKTRFALLTTYATRLGLLKLGSELAGEILIPEVLDKLPSDMVLKYNLECRPHTGDFQSLLTHFAEQIKGYELTEASSSKRTPLPADNKKKDPLKPADKTGTMNTMLTTGDSKSKPQGKASAASPRVVKCPFCEEAHYPTQCSKCGDADKRYQLAKEKRLCFNCLTAGHPIFKCASAGRCRTCGKKHHTALHRDIESSQSQAAKMEVKDLKDVSPSTTVMMTSEAIQFMAFMAIATAPSGGTPIRIRGIIDSASHRSYITRQLIDALHLARKSSVTMSSTTFSDQTPTLKEYEVFGCRLQSCYGGASKEFDFFATESLPKVKSYSGPHIIQRVRMQNLPMAEPLPPITDEVHILIGERHIWRVLQSGQRRISADAGLLSTIFGWVVSGVLRHGNASGADEVVNLNCTTMDISQEEPSLQQFWDLEAIGINSNEKESDFVRQHFDETVQQTDEGRYTVSLPFNSKISKLETNLDSAISQLASTLKRIDGKPALQARYNDAIKAYENENHAEKILNLNTKGPVYYIPHHPVVREDRATTKFRVVFNASSAKKEGLSLNDCTYPGPSLLPEVTAVALRFRLQRYVALADLKKAFLQVEIQEDFRDVLRFLWVDEDFFQSSFNWKNFLRHLVTYRMKVVPFGLNASPFLLNVVIRKQASLCKDTYPKEAEILDKSMYVDDLTVGADTEEELIQLSSNLNLILSRAKLPLVKWITSSSTVSTTLRQQNFEMREETEQDLPITKILGLCWEPNMDLIKYDKLQDFRRCTKRHLCSLLASVFDPLGLLAPALLELKLLMQRTWVEDIGWDEVLNEEYQSKIANWRLFFEKILCLEFPRWVGTLQSQEIFLEIYCDASLLAYGCVIYVVSPDNKRCLLISKSRVAPIKRLTLPKLELTAALLGARLFAYVQTTLPYGYKLATPKFFTDSQVTLAWIISTKNVWKPYVTNRVHEILTLTSVEQWYYITTANNPADLLTRTDRAAELLTKTLWTQGSNIVEEIQYKEGQLPEPEEDKRSSADNNVVNLILEESDFELELVRFSNLKRMIRVFTWILRWKKGLGQELTLDELNFTKNRLILQSQSFWFSPELRAIAEEGKVHKSSKICKYRPFKDNKGFLRLGGRLDQALLTSEEKHPIFLHHSSRLTKLLILDVHLQLKHGEVSEVLFHMRKKFWILRGRRTVRSALRDCLVCRRSKLEVPDPVFAPLPSERVTPANPFQHCGLDYLGPLQIRDLNNKLQKVYILLFTCMVTRAVHLEVTESLNTEHFLLALRKFGALHGYPAKLFSDNAKTFHRANLELKTWGTLLSSSRISRFFSDKGIRWSFIAPLAPNWGGVWERLVKLVKEKLRRVLRQDTCSLNVLDTHCKEISSIINSRPLVYVTESDGNEFALTPEHFLTGNMPKVLLTKPTDKIGNKDLRRLEKTRRKNIYTFWQTWKCSYLQQLRNFHESRGSQTDDILKVGNVVLVEKTHCNPYFWPLGRVSKLFPGRDGLARAAECLMGDGSSLVRPVTKLRKLEAEC